MDREYLKDKKKIVIKIGSSSLIHEETGGLDYTKLEKLVRIICDLRNQDKDVVLVSSGAIGVGVQALGLARRPKTTSLRQACAAVGQGQLMMIYQKLFQAGSGASLKNHSRNLHAPLCGIFHPNLVAVARYGALIRAKYPTNCDAHLAESLFQTRSSK